MSLAISDNLNPVAGRTRYQHGIFYFPAVISPGSIPPPPGYSGCNDRGEPNAIVYFSWKGNYSYCDPRAFSNYFLLKKEITNTYSKSLAFTQTLPQRPGMIITRRKAVRREFLYLQRDHETPAAEICFLDSDGTARALPAFGGKRLQRIIEKRKPNVNTNGGILPKPSGRLYLQKKDNRNIADKMITYFNEFIRNKYFLNTNVINEDFITNLWAVKAVYPANRWHPCIKT